MADAYATIANGGTHYDPECILRIEDRKGNVLVDNSDPVGETALSPEIAHAASEVMKGVIESYDGTAPDAALAERPDGWRQDGHHGRLQGPLVLWHHAAAFGGHLDRRPEGLCRRHADPLVHHLRERLRRLPECGIGRATPGRLPPGGRPSLRDVPRCRKPYWVGLLCQFGSGQDAADEKPDDTKATEPEKPDNPDGTTPDPDDNKPNPNPDDTGGGDSRRRRRR